MTLCKTIEEFLKQNILRNLFNSVLLISFGMYNKNKVQFSLNTWLLYFVYFKISVRASEEIFKNG